MGSGKRSDYLPDEERGASFAQIPTSFGHELRACLRCRLVKTYDQFRESGCENCPFLEMDKEHDNVVNCTTPNFTGIISVMDPTRSWAARWLRIACDDPDIIDKLSTGGIFRLLGTAYDPEPAEMMNLKTLKEGLSLDVILLRSLRNFQKNIRISVRITTCNMFPQNVPELI